MRDEEVRILQQIAIDVAVIKNEIENIKKDTDKIDKTIKDIEKVKTQISVAKWVSSVLGVGVITLLLDKLRNIL